MDTSKVFGRFFQECSAAGKNRCAFWESEPNVIRAKWNALLEKVQKEPIPVYIAGSASTIHSDRGCGTQAEIADADSIYGILDSSVLRVTVFRSLYAPYYLFQPLATALHALHDLNDPSPLYLLYNAGQKRFQCPSACNDETEDFDNFKEAAPAIMCQDAALVPGTVEEAELYLARVQNVNAEWWDVWSVVRTSCSGYPQLPKDTFIGET
jgi:hypothetical protein